MLRYESNTMSRCLGSNYYGMAHTGTVSISMMKLATIFELRQWCTGTLMALAETKGTSSVLFGEILGVLAVLVVEKRSIE